MKLKLVSSSLHLLLLISVFISDGIYTVYSSRNLLRTTEKFSSQMVFTPCIHQETSFRPPKKFHFMNYTIITSRCKGPHFQHIECCDAFKEFACPYRNYINDESTDCLTLMLSNIKLYGGYPVGLFSSYCLLYGKQLSDC
ncbi:hypothetical protein HID58_084633 [Brassica napus]|uniref:GPI-anchored protein LLG1-like domain-containing protein n=1 Tax=Brassica napus TaxID=3708 RepID=A0ABQ7XKC8_BRANA|nr:hypothetical protein HID58_084633 [Brassica napus]